MIHNECPESGKEGGGVRRVQDLYLKQLRMDFAEIVVGGFATIAAMRLVCLSAVGEVCVTSLNFVISV